MLKYIVRPRSILRTPRALADALDITTRKFPSSRNHFNAERAFFMAYPNIERVHFVDTGDELATVHSRYRNIQSFYAANKLEQRFRLQLLRMPTPESTGSRYDAAWRYSRDASTTKYIVRSLRHSQGRNYRITNDATDFQENEEYVSRVFPKTREYRIITVYGEPIIVLKKQVPEGVSSELPWNHATGSTFTTLSAVNHGRLRRTDVFEQLKRSALVQNADILGIDILYKEDGEYVICEVNFCPALTIDRNIETVAQYIKTHERQAS